MNETSEPFVLVTFSPSFAGGATFTSSQEIIEADHLESIRKKHRTNLYERFRGFGIHYYSVTFTIISVECCDNRTHYRTCKEYMNRKMEAYSASIASMDRGFTIPHQNRRGFQLWRNIDSR